MYLASDQDAEQAARVGIAGPIYKYLDRYPNSQGVLEMFACQGKWDI